MASEDVVEVDVKGAGVSEGAGVEELDRVGSLEAAGVVAGAVAFEPDLDQALDVDAESSDSLVWRRRRFDMSF